MTEQEAFNKAYLGLRGQFFTRAKEGSGWAAVCAYRTRDGLKCAVGHLLTDEEIDEIGAASGIPLLELVRKFAPQSIAGLTVDFLADLQAVHDFGPEEQMSSRLKILAARKRLTVPA